MRFKAYLLSIFKLSIAGLLTFSLTSCSSISKTYPQGDFHIMVISDTHISSDEKKEQRLNLLVEKINTGTYPGVELLFVTGDVGSSFFKNLNSENPELGDNRVRKAVNILNKLTIPYHMAMGNHDYKRHSDRDSDLPFTKEELNEMEGFWKETTGLNPYYSFIHQGWKFIILNSMRANYLGKNFDDEQLLWLKNELKENKKTLLFFHHPLETDNLRLWGKFHSVMDNADEPLLYEILENNTHLIKGIFVGHGHSWVQDKLFNTIKVYETSSFGEDENFPFLIIGIDKKNQAIKVARSPLEMIQ